MTDEQITIKSIEKAVKNGWVDGKIIFSYRVRGKDVIEDPSGHFIRGRMYYLHGFAKAFWKDWKWYKEGEQGRKDGLTIWQYHLQQMVLEFEPLKYLEKFLT